jgi:hypothetical protein
MEVEVVLTSHRVEFLSMLRDEALSADVIVLEEPSNENLYRFFKNEITAEEYVRSLDTAFPLYTYFLSDLLKNLHQMGKRIYQVEPYLETIQRIQRSIEDGTFSEVTKDDATERIRQIEKKAFGAFIDYQEAFMYGDFDELVEKTIEFSKADAERFKFRDGLRFRRIVELIDWLREREDDPGLKVLIEAGSIHSNLPSSLEEVLETDYVRSLNLKEIAAKMIGVKLVDNPGTKLTEVFIRRKKIDEGKLRTLAARSLVYISKITPDEMLPEGENRFPHLVEELSVTNEVDRMDYESCRKEFQRIWKERFDKFGK